MTGKSRNHGKKNKTLLIVVLCIVVMCMLPGWCGPLILYSFHSANGLLLSVTCCLHLFLWLWLCFSRNCRILDNRQDVTSLRQFLIQHLFYTNRFQCLIKTIHSPPMPHAEKTADSKPPSLHQPWILIEFHTFINSPWVQDGNSVDWVKVFWAEKTALSLQSGSPQG